MVEDGNLKREFLIEEYSQSWETIRHSDDIFWKIPSVAITVYSYDPKMYHL